VVDVYSIGGGRARNNMRAWIDVRITLDRFTDRGVFRKFRAMINHLERGGVVAFGNDHQKAIFAQLTNKKFQGNSSAQVYESMTGEYSSGSTATTVFRTGDEIVIEGSLPKANRDYARITYDDSAYSEGKATYYFTADPLTSDYADRSHVRHSDFFPTCILPAGSVGSALLTHDRRLTYTLDLTLTYILPYIAPKETTEPQPAVPADNTGNAGDKPDYDSVDGG
jgi:hypothetical protein